MRMKENKIMKMISRRDFMKASAVVGAAGVLTACGGSHTRRLPVCWMAEP